MEAIQGEQHIPLEIKSTVSRPNQLRDSPLVTKLAHTNLFRLALNCPLRVHDGHGRLILTNDRPNMRPPHFGEAYKLLPPPTISSVPTRIKQLIYFFQCVGLLRTPILDVLKKKKKMIATDEWPFLTDAEVTVVSS